MRRILLNLRSNTMRAVAIGLLSVVFSISIGLVVGVGGMGAEHGAMIGCPFMEGDQTLCPMAAVEHLATWQGLAGSTPERFGIIAVISLVLTISLFLAAKEMERWKRSSISLGYRQALYERHFPDARLFVIVKKLFSQGILNPKVFTAYVA
ncbi:MAG: hypothetical protein HY422_00550 [Candidatus Komeilibacteria bacterium]|nr:hypothetical protein [Candidatus Komeilibacteria bacterium]